VDALVHPFAMTQPDSRRSPRTALWGLLFGALALLAVASPAAAQYGGTPTLFVDPVLVEIDTTFDAVGFNCPAGSIVTITMDGIAGTLTTTTTADDSSYSSAGINMPEGIVAGEDYDVRASCAGDSATFTITAVCNGGAFPVDGSCPGGTTVGGENPDPSSTTTSTTTPGGGTTGQPGNPTGIGTTDLAVTGASFAEQAAQIGITLVALGAILVLVATRRGRISST
jgi:hypothetical protein